MTTLVILALAVAQIARLLLIDNGPARIFWHLRERFGANERKVPAGGLAELFNCPNCMSVNIMLGVAAAWYWLPQWFVHEVAFWLAVSFIASWAVKVSRR